MTIEKLLRTVRLDDSDEQVYEHAAQAGEWAVIGSFYFWDADLEQLSGPARQAFVHGFLGTDSFGWSTVVAVADITPVDVELVTQRLARHLIEHFGAPNMAAALPAAREEIEFVAGLCDHEVNTLLAIQRDFADDHIQENFKVIKPPSGVDHAQVSIWGVDSDDRSF